jgi:hypothetical protein
MNASRGRVEIVSDIKDTAEYNAVILNAVSELTIVPD